MPQRPVLPLDYMARIERESGARQLPADPITATIQSMREEEARQTILTAPKPDQVARTTRLAREVDEAPGHIEGREDDAERLVNADRMTRVLGRYPVFTKWAVKNPRAVAAASDDHRSLGLLGQALKVLDDVQQRLAAGSLWGVAGALENDPFETGSPLRGIGPAMGVLSDLSAAYRRESAAILRKEADKARARGRADNWIADAALSGLEAIPLTAAALLTRNPTVATAIPALSVRGNALAEAREQGLTGPKAQVYGALQGGIEYATERLPMGVLVEALVKRTPYGKAVVRQLATELPGEQVATALQDLTDWAMLPENENKTFGDYLAERPSAALQTAIASTSGTTAQTALAVAVDRSARAAGKVAGRVSEAREARRMARVIDQMGKAAEASKLRQRDPEGFREMMRELTEQTGVTHVFIPGDAIRAYRQSDSYEVVA